MADTTALPSLHIALGADERFALWFLRNSYVGGRAMTRPEPGTVDPLRGFRTRLVLASGAESGRERSVQRVGLGGTYLVPHEVEEQEDFINRLRAAYAINLCAPVVDKYVSAVYARQISRQLARPDLAEVMTASGQEPDLFFADACRWALVYERAFVVSDLPRAETNEGYQSLAEERAARAGQPYSWLLHPQHMLDYTLDDEGRITGALVCEGHGERVFNPRGDGAPLPMRVRAWWPDHWELYEVDDRWSVTREVETGDGFGFVPISPVVFRPTDSSCLRGRSLIADVAPMQLEMLQLLSFLGDYHRYQGFPQLFVGRKFGGDATLAADVELSIGTHRLNAYDAEGGAPLWIAPSSECAQELRQQIEWLAQRAMESAGVARRAAQSQQVASGDALAWEWLDFGFLAGEVSQMMEQAERTVHAQRQALATGVTDWQALLADQDVRYPHEFRPIDSGDLLAEMKLLVDAGVGGSFEQEALVHLARRYLADLPPERLTEIVDAMRVEHAGTEAAVQARLAAPVAPPTSPMMSVLRGGAAAVGGPPGARGMAA